MPKGHNKVKPEKARYSLRAKYHDICHKYETLVRKLEDASSERIGVFQLGWWALRTTASALALVRNGTIYLCNNRWRELDAISGSTRVWELVSSGGTNTITAARATLRDLALDEARRLLDRRGQFS